MSRHDRLADRDYCCAGCAPCRRPGISHPRGITRRGGNRLLNPFLDPALDLAHEGPPRLVYIVAATPRSGSTLLCRELWSTGLLGAPYEYLNAESAMLELVLRFQTASLGEF